MQRLISSLFSLLIIFGCEDPVDVKYGPCEFPSAKTKFQTFNYWCKDCFVELDLFNQQYRFNGNQFESAGAAANWNPPELPYLVRSTQNSFFNLNFVSPLTVQDLRSGLGNKTALLRTDSLSKLTGQIPNATVTFGIFDYCREFFQPITNDVERSSHELTGIELIESYPVEVYYEPYQLSYFYCTGNLNMTFLINDQVSLATGRYKIKVEIWEKL